MAYVIERRIDRSNASSEALDQLLWGAVRRHDLEAAVLADEYGMLVAAARDRGAGERIAGVVSLVASLQGALSDHRVLDDLSQAFLRASDGRGLALWPFEVAEEDARFILAALYVDTPPDDESVEAVMEGVKRILAARESMEG